MEAFSYGLAGDTAPVTLLPYQYCQSRIDGRNGSDACTIIAVTHAAVVFAGSTVIRLRRRPQTRLRDLLTASAEATRCAISQWSLEICWQCTEPLMFCQNNHCSRVLASEFAMLKTWKQDCGGVWKRQHRRKTSLQVH